MTSSVELAQTPFAIVHLKVAEPPTANPVTPEVANEGVVMVAVPRISVHVPVPVVGTFPAKVAVVTLHRFWSGPAAATVGFASTLMTIVSTELGQTPLEIVQVKVSVLPIVNPVTAEVGSAATVTLDKPKITAHAPVPEEGVFPAKVAVVTLHRFWSMPAAAVVGVASVEMTTSSVEATHAPLEIVQRKVAEASSTNPVTPEVGLVGSVIVAVPENTLQFPVPNVGALPAKVAVVTPHRFWSGPAAATVGRSATLIMTVSTEFGQTPLEIVQVNVSDEPIVKPVMPEIGLAGAVTIDKPPITAQRPLPIVGVFPAKVDVVTLHRFWSGPAAAVVEFWSTLITTVSISLEQAPLEIVQVNVSEEPGVNPVTVEVELDGVVTVDEPKITAHAPVPVTGVFPAKVVVVAQMVWSGPASDTVGISNTFTSTISEETQPASVIVHSN